jgi:hypothetical protein
MDVALAVTSADGVVSEDGSWPQREAAATSWSVIHVDRNARLVYAAISRRSENPIVAGGQQRIASGGQLPDVRRRDRERHIHRGRE